MSLLGRFFVLCYKIRYGKNLSFVNHGIAIFHLYINGSALFYLKKGKISKSTFHIIGKNNSFIFDDHVTVRNCRFIVKGDNCIVDLRGCSLFDSRFELLDSETRIEINKDTIMTTNRIVVAGGKNQLHIGKGCLFAENAEVWTSDTHSLLDMNTNKRINPDKPVYIGDRLWLGNRALILKGVNIGNDTIVAAGSIVTKDIPNNTLVAGIPAVAIKTCVNWNETRIEEIL